MKTRATSVLRPRPREDSLLPFPVPPTFSFLISFITNLYIHPHRRLDRLPAHGALLHEPRVVRARDAVRAQDVAARYQPVWESKFYGAFVQILRVVLHAIDATPARWLSDAGSLPLGRARTAASLPRNEHPTHWLISTQVEGRKGWGNLLALSLGCW